MNTTNLIIVITGPTAVGKTKLAVALAHSLKGEIINADSRQVYRRMDIGTGKDISEYDYKGHKIPYHLIDICEPGYQYNIKEYQQDFSETYNKLKAANTPAILCGGSGLYIESAISGNPFAFIPVNEDLRGRLSDESKSRLMGMISDDVKEQLHINSLTTQKRLIRAVEITNFVADKALPVTKEQLPAIIFALSLDRKQVMQRIKDRLRLRLDNGMINEVKCLLDEGLLPEQLMYYGLEYKWLTMYVMGEISYDYMFDRLNIAIRQFAKRQMTWFRRMEKNGYQLNWLDGDRELDSLLSEIRMILDRLQNIKG